MNDVVHRKVDFLPKKELGLGELRGVDSVADWDWENGNGGALEFDTSSFASAVEVERTFPFSNHSVTIEEIYPVVKPKLSAKTGPLRSWLLDWSYCRRHSSFCFPLLSFVSSL